jgi:hypothetical protein
MLAKTHAPANLAFVYRTRRHLRQLADISRNSLLHDSTANTVSAESSIRDGSTEEVNKSVTINQSKNQRTPW